MRERMRATRAGRFLPAAAMLLAALAGLYLLARQPWVDITAPGAGPVLQPGYAYTGGPVVTLELKDFSCLPRALVLVNNEPRAAFTERYVTVPVADRDLITVDGSFYTHPLEVEVLEVSRGVTSPPVGRTVEVDGTVAAVGRVRLSG